MQSLEFVHLYCQIYLFLDNFLKYSEWHYLAGTQMAAHVRNSSFSFIYLFIY